MTLHFVYYISYNLNFTKTKSSNLNLQHNNKTTTQTGGCFIGAPQETLLRYRYVALARQVSPLKPCELLAFGSVDQRSVPKA